LRFIKNNAIYISIAIGSIAFCILLNPLIIIPTQINWIGSGDPTSAYLGWAFYRNDPWTIPIGLIPGYGMGQNSSLVFSDTVPLLSYIFKLFRIWLPVPFQFFGIWYALIFIGQAFFAWKLAKLITSDLISIICIALIFILSPALLGMMVVGWSSEAGHFLILAALYLNIANRRPVYIYWWTLLLVISVSVCFYIFFSIFVLWIAFIFDAFQAKNTNLKNRLTPIAITLGLVAFAAWMAGYFSTISNQAQGVLETIGDEGYGSEYRFDILSLFYNSYWSYVLNGLPTSLIPKYGPTDLFLGLGVVAGCAFVIYYYKYVFHCTWKFIGYKKYFFLALCILFLIGLTNTIRIGTLTITFPIPDYFYSYLSVIRSSRRIVWPFYYCLYFLIFYVILKKLTIQRARSVIVAIFILQFTDMSAGWLPMREGFGSRVVSGFHSALQDSLWTSPELLERYKRIIRAPMEGSRITMATNQPESWEIFGHYAAKNSMALNAVAVARGIRTTIMSLNDEIDKSIRSGNYDDSTIYVVDDEHVLPVLRHINPSRDLFIRLDEFNVLLPGWLNCSKCPPIDAGKIITTDLFMKKDISNKILFDNKSNGYRLLLGVGQAERLGWGWSYPEAWGAWSEGYRAIVTLPYPENAQPSKLRITLKPFLAQNYKSQNVGIIVNNTLQKTVTLNQALEILDIELPTTSYKDYVVIEFLLPSAVSPSELGTGDDIRRLGIGIISSQFISNE